MSKNKLTKFVKSINLFKIYDGLNESKVADWLPKIS